MMRGQAGGGQRAGRVGGSGARVGGQRALCIGGQGVQSMHKEQQGNERWVVVVGLGVSSSSSSKVERVEAVPCALRVPAEPVPLAFGGSRQQTETRQPADATARHPLPVHCQSAASPTAARHCKPLDSRYVLSATRWSGPSALLALVHQNSTASGGPGNAATSKQSTAPQPRLPRPPPLDAPPLYHSSQAPISLTAQQRNSPHSI
jgi:hypothetical protein